MPSLKTKEAIASLNNDIIPAAQAKLAEINPVFSNVLITVDTDSFGNDDTELDYIYNTTTKVFDGLKKLHDRSAVAKSELETQLKKISYELKPGAEEKAVTFETGELHIVTNSYNNNYISSSDVVSALEEGL